MSSNCLHASWERTNHSFFKTWQLGTTPQFPGLPGSMLNDPIKFSLIVSEKSLKRPARKVDMPRGVVLVPKAPRQLRPWRSTLERVFDMTLSTSVIVFPSFTRAINQGGKNVSVLWAFCMHLLPSVRPEHGFYLASQSACGPSILPETLVDDQC